MHLDPSAPNFTRSSYIKLAVRFCIAQGAHHCAAMVDKRLNEGSIEHVESRQHSASKCAGVDSAYGFNITTERGQPLVFFAYATQAAAEAAAAHVRLAIKEAVRVRPHG